MKKLLTVAAAITLTVPLAFINTAPAQALDDRLLDPTSYKVADVVVGKKSQLCVNRSLTIKGKVRDQPSWTGYSDVDMAISVYGPTEDYVGQEPIWISNPPINKKTQTFNVKSNFYTCVHGHGYGRYTVGDASLRYGLNGDSNLRYSPDWALFEVNDISRSYYYVRGAAKSTLKATRKGKYITLSASASRYALSQTLDEYGMGWETASGKFKPYNAKKAKIQVKSGSTWKTLKTVNLKNGKANIKFKKSTKQQYRMAFAQTSTTTGATSSTVKK